MTVKGPYNIAEVQFMALFVQLKQRFIFLQQEKTVKCFDELTSEDADWNDIKFMRKWVSDNVCLDILSNCVHSIHKCACLEDREHTERYKIWNIQHAI